MRRRVMMVAVATLVVMLLGSSAALAKAPQGKGLNVSGEVQCEGFGTVVVLEPGQENSATAWDLITGTHVVLVRIDATITVDGTVVDQVSQTYGTKAGLESFPCTGTAEEDGATIAFTAEVAMVPPSR